MKRDLQPHELIERSIDVYKRQVCSKPILSYRAVARVSIEFAMQIPKIRGHVPRIFDFWREKVSV